jgi:hypothetical protein
MRRTVILADEEVLRRLREIAKRENMTLSDAIRAALDLYVSHGQPRRPRLSPIGIGRSGRRDVAGHAEEWQGKGFGR